jgi:hypothetical protein
MGLKETNRQADIISFYLIGRAASSHSKRMYEKVLKDSEPESIDPKDQKIINFAFKHKKTIRLLDSAMALLRPQSELRRRIYIMFAILEAHPDNFDKFISIKKGHLYKVAFVLRVSVATLSAIVGVALAFVVELKP